jgi:uncharacterized membrane protein YedE/YeeE
MKKIVTSFFCGIVFALGLGISGMTEPPVILGFLNLSGVFNPALGVVFVTAVSFYSLGYWLLIHPNVRASFEAALRPKERLAPRVLIRVLIGSLLFGIGWGLAGLCPGPTVVNLASGKWELYLFALFLLLGMQTVKLFLR